MLLAVAALTLTACTGSPPSHDGPWMSRIPNTGRMTAAVGSMYVSPDEEWITFFEQNGVGLAVGLASIELATGRRVEHHLDQLPPADMARLGSDPFNLLEANQGAGAGWRDGILYLSNPARGPRDALVVVNSEPAITCGSKPRGRLLMSDGPAWYSWSQTLKGRLGQGSAVNGLWDAMKCSAAWRNGRYDETTYAYDADSRAIVAREAGHETQKIAGLPRSGPFRDVKLKILRVSPGESYLAYVLSYGTGLILSPVMKDVVKIVDLATGRTRTVCSFRLVGNLFWSGGGRQLFLTGNDPDESRGVYVVDVGEVFGVGQR